MPRPSSSSTQDGNAGSGGGGGGSDDGGGGDGGDDDGGGQRNSSSFSFLEFCSAPDLRAAQFLLTSGDQGTREEVAVGRGGGSSFRGTCAGLARRDRKGHARGTTSV